MARRKQELYTVTVTDPSGVVLHTLTPVNLHCIPGVLYALRSMFPGATVQDQYIGQGYMPGQGPGESG